MPGIGSAFREAVASELSEMDDAALEAQLGPLLDAARASWPGLTIADDVFASYVGERVADEDDPVAVLATRCLGDLYLACGCVRGERAALAAFDPHCLDPIAPAIRRIDSSPAFLDEVRQQVRVGLLITDGSRPKRLANYRGSGKLRSWVQVGAVRTALELLRRNRPHDNTDDDRLFDAAAMDEDPELKHIKQLYRGEFRVAFQGALADLEPRQRNVLRMYLVDGLNIDQIGLAYHVHRATVARWIARAREDLLAGTRDRLMDALQITTTQFDSLMGVVRSHLDLSMERLLVDDRK